MGGGIHTFAHQRGERRWRHLHQRLWQEVRLGGTLQHHRPGHPPCRALPERRRRQPAEVPNAGGRGACPRHMYHLVRRQGGRRPAARSFQVGQ